MFFKASELEGSLTLPDIPNLSFLMHEIALISICKSGIINYPDSRMKKGMILDQISTSFAINELLKNVNDYSLSEKEIKFIQEFFEQTDFAEELERIKALSEKIEDLSVFELFEFAKEMGFLDET